ncbi:hypothetical protein WOLCODRAFT_149743 [Wolfiporia cocos MD-104 SS10]|uniref:Retrotransposon gag domain-containing protein n=1 Tax=Wolfiporia cocos (strain MD-104) TaxID=742152 RepID=A0A2H3JLN8_WOLCO|nr:hypothetical protein WOLCODRAFT_149743 [Wolfiporia cocos MD-104 SS10]
MRQKATLPPEFSDEDSKVQVQEWLHKCIMYFGVARITDDCKQIVQALQHLSGSAFDYQEQLIQDSADLSKSLGMWMEFKNQMEWVYRKKTDEEVARKEIESYFSSEGKKKANANFYTYAECLRQLAKKAKTENTTLMKKLKDIMPEKVKDTFTLAKVFGNKIPTEWELYLNQAISIHKEVYHDAITGSIFDNGKEKEKKMGSLTKSSNTITKESQTSSQQRASGGDGGKQRIPKGSVPRTVIKKTKAEKYYFWAPPHKCTICKCDNCQSGGTKCFWKPTTSIRSSATALATRGDKRKGQHIREIVPEYFVLDDETAPAAPTVGMLVHTSTHIEEVPEESVVISISSPTPLSEGSNYSFLLGSSSGFFEGRM